MPNIIINFWKDYTDKGASKLSRGFTLPDLWALAGAALSATSVFANSLKTGLIDLFGINAALIPVILLFFAVLWCIYCIWSKKGETQTGLIHKPVILTYSNPQYVRIIAKSLLPFFLAAMVLSAIKLSDQLRPLPQTIEGVITSLANGQPIQNARVRIIASDGNDVTKGESFTDQSGYYIIYTIRQQKKDAKLLVILPSCEKQVSASLLSSFLKETIIDHKKKNIYNHSVEANCK